MIAGVRDNELVAIIPCWHPPGSNGDWRTLGAFRADYTEVYVADRDAAVATWKWLEHHAPCDRFEAKHVRADCELARALDLKVLEPRGRALHTARNVLSGHFRHTSAARRSDHPRADKELVATLSSRVHSKDTKRKLNLLARGGEVTYAALREPALILAQLSTFFAMHEKEFGETGRTSQFTSPMERDFYERLTRSSELAGIVTLDVLSVAGRPAAMHLGFQTESSYLWYKPTFDSFFAKASPGRVMLARVFERVAREGVDEVDLLRGLEGYKADWSNRVVATLDVAIRSLRLGDALGVARRKLEQLR